jgi:putative hydrolase of the HAD superfamily
VSELLGDATAVLFDAGETLLSLDLAAIASACGPEPDGRPVDVATVSRALVRARRQLDAFFLPELAQGRFTPQAAFRSGRGHAVHELVLVELGLGGDRLARAVASLIELDRDGNRLWTVVTPDVVPALEGLAARGLELGVVSNSEGRIRAKLAREGLGRFFDVVVDSHEERVSKPDPEIFRRGCARLGVEPARTVYVGDLYAIDVAAAGLAGLRGILLDRHGGYETPPCARIAALTDLLRS